MHSNMLIIVSQHRILWQSIDVQTNTDNVIAFRVTYFRNTLTASSSAQGHNLYKTFLEFLLVLIRIILMHALDFAFVYL